MDREALLLAHRANLDRLVGQLAEDFEIARPSALDYPSDAVLLTMGETLAEGL